MKIRQIGRMMLALATAITYLVEKPCAKWIKRALSRKDA